MNDMPMFDDPIPAPQEAPGPKKPRPKPAKKRKVRKAAKKRKVRKAAKVAAPKSVKKRRKRKARVLIPPTETHVKGLEISDINIVKAIGVLMDMKPSERKLAIDIVQGLTERRSA